MVGDEGREGMYFTRLGSEDGGAGAFAVEAEESHCLIRMSTYEEYLGGVGERQQGVEMAQLIPELLS